MEGDTVQVLDNTGGLAKQGYKFGGWMVDNIIFQPGDTFVMGNGDLILTAVWIPVYRVIYDANAAIYTGSPPHDPVEYPSGAHVAVKHDSGKLLGMGIYDFICWNTKQDGSGTDYYPGSTLIIENSDITLYAKYKTYLPPFDMS